MIKAGDMGAVSRLIKQMGIEISNIVKSALEISYYSRGGWSYETVLNMSQGERDLALEFINERLKVAAKQTFPVY